QSKPQRGGPQRGRASAGKTSVGQTLAGRTSARRASIRRGRTPLCFPELEGRHMAGTVIFLGAGATKACEGLLTNEILHAILGAPDPCLGPSCLTFSKSFFTSISSRHLISSPAFRWS